MCTDVEDNVSVYFQGQHFRSLSLCCVGESILRGTSPHATNLLRSLCNSGCGFGDGAGGLTHLNASFVMNKEVGDHDGVSVADCRDAQKADLPVHRTICCTVSAQDSSDS